RAAATMDSTTWRPSRRMPSSARTAIGTNNVTSPSSTCTGRNRIRASRSEKLRTSSATPAVVPCSYTDMSSTTTTPAAYSTRLTRSTGWRTRGSAVSTTRTVPSSSRSRGARSASSAPVCGRGSGRPRLASEPTSTTAPTWDASRAEGSGAGDDMRASLGAGVLAGAGFGRFLRVIRPVRPLAGRPWGPVRRAGVSKPSLAWGGAPQEVGMARGTTTERPAAGDPATPDEDGQERNPFRKVWWLPVVRGTLLVVLGLLLMIEPLERLGTLRVVLGAFLVADGVLVAVQGFVHRRQVGSAWWLAQAGVNVVFGVVVALWPDLTATAVYYVLAVWVLVLGITTIAGAAALARNRDLGWAWMLAVGIVSVLFGVLLVTRPLDSFDVLRLVAVVFALYAFV